MVTGNIYLRTFVPIEARHIEIVVRGREKVAFVDQVIENVNGR